MKNFLTILIFLNLLFSANLTYAAGAAVTYSGVEGQLTQYLCTPSGNPSNGDLYTCINKLYKFSLVIASVIAVFYIVVAGYVYMSAGGNQESVDKAKSIIESSITALVILFAGFILLKALNPDLIQFQSIQPASVIGTLPGGGAGDGRNSNNTTVTDLQGSGCAFQTDKQKTEAPKMASQLVSIVKNICYNIVKQNNGNNYQGTQGHPPTISSVIGEGQHAENSYHYKGCAVDFADGGGNGFFDYQTKTGRSTGVAIYKEAQKNGISEDRIDPGSDRTVTNMIHIDLGSSCPN